MSNFERESDEPEEPYSLGLGENPSNYAPQDLFSDEERRELEWGLPHLFSFKWYQWAREFFESRNPVALLCAANQASKSSTQIRKCIEWATNQELWAELWPDTIKSGQLPNQFWYMYPSQKVVDGEWLTKWSQFLPRGRFKSDPYYGWKPLKDGSKVIGIQFNSGVVVFFKTYSQKTIDIQTGSVFALFADEEMPLDKYDEIIFRITATKGYFNMVFTATLGQDFWRKSLEPMEHEEENFVGAWKRQISLYDCMYYEDGTPSGRTHEDIKVIERRCSTHEELLRRVHGKFITPLQGRKYPTFDAKKHYTAPHKIPDDWELYCGIDIGSGGEEGHPSAIAFVAVDKEYTQGRLFFMWAGNEEENTTAGDVMDKFLEVRKERNLTFTRQFYDQGCRDFKTISERIHEPFEGAEKDHEIGDEIVNLLFKNNMILVFNDSPDLMMFGTEIATIKKSTPKRKRKDDRVDGFRYAVTKIPWKFSEKMLAGITPPPPPPPKEETSDERQKKERIERARSFRRGYRDADDAACAAEFAELNDLYGS